MDIPRAFPPLFWLAAVSVGLFPCSAAAPGPCAHAAPCAAAVTQQSEPAGEDAFTLLEAEYELAREAWRTAIRSAADASERFALVSRPPARDFEARFRLLADGGEPRALAWLLAEADSLRPMLSERRELRHAACRDLVELHVSSPWFRANGLETLRHERAGLGDAYVPLLLSVADWASATGEVELKVQALATAARALSASPEEEERALGLRFYERILAENADAPAAASLRAEYLRKKNLRVGMVVPDFEFATLIGERHALSELRGEVVLIDFWGLWCPQCMIELPQLKELAARFTDEPFALLGVATDGDPEAFVAKTRQLGVTWLQAWDGGKRGTIASAWGIDEFPTKILLDRRGRVRHFNPRTADLGRLIEALLREELESGAGDER